MGSAYSNIYAFFESFNTCGVEGELKQFPGQVKNLSKTVGDSPHRSSYFFALILSTFSPPKHMWIFGKKYVNMYDYGHQEFWTDFQALLLRGCMGGDRFLRECQKPNHSITTKHLWPSQASCTSTNFELA